jgi:hypothetical protein
MPQDAGVEVALAVEQAVVDDAADRRGQLFLIQGLDEELRCPEPHRLEPGLDASLGAQHEHRVFPCPLLDQGLPKVQGPGMIQQDQIRRLGHQFPLRLGAIPSQGNPKPPFPEIGGNKPQGTNISANQQDAIAHA